MKRAYPIVLELDNEGFLVYVPDFTINTQGQDVAEAMEMARDAIGIVGIVKEDNKEALPEASTMEAIQKEYPEAIVTLVDVDFTEYRRRNDVRTVRKNCTIPSWMNSAAESAGLNFSALLQTAIKQELQSHDK